VRASEELLAVAELAIALAGFSGVVVAFARDGKLSPVDRWRFAGLLSVAMGAAAIAFVPSILHHLGVSAGALWRASSVVLLLVSAPYLLIFPPRVTRVAREHGAEAPRSFMVGTFGLVALNLGMQVSNAVGWPGSPGPGLLIAGLVVWLIVASLGFALLVLSRSAD
jgi:hypothetical protein